MPTKTVSSSTEARLAELDQEIASRRATITEIDVGIAQAADERDEINKRWKLHRARRSHIGANARGEIDQERIRAEHHEPDAAFQAELAPLHARIGDLNRQKRTIRDQLAKLIDERGPLRRTAEELQHGGDTAALAAQVTSTKAELDRLMAEQDDLSTLIAAAQAVPDSAEAARLQFRLRDIPVHIAATRSSLYRCQISHTEALLAEALEQDDHADEIARAEDAVTKAQQKLQEAQARQAAVSYEQNKLRVRIKTLQSKLKTSG